MDKMMGRAEHHAAQQDRQTVISLKYSYAHALAAYVAYLAELTLQLTQQNV
jgi:hypothetical protein